MLSIHTPSPVLNIYTRTQTDQIDSIPTKLTSFDMSYVDGGMPVLVRGTRAPVHLELVDRALCAPAPVSLRHLVCHWP